METWQALSRRLAQTPPETPYEGVPDHLEGPLRAWVGNTAGLTGSALMVGLGLALRIEWETDYTSPGLVARDFLEAALPQLGSDGLLDVVDAVLHQAGGRRTFSASGVAVESALERLLAMGGSAWRVGDSGLDLQRRVSDEARRAFDDAVASAKGAASGVHLIEAWRVAYGRNPDATKAYSEAVKAVEVAAIPTVTPNDKTATLGKVIGELGSRPAAFGLAIEGDVLVIRDLLRLLWEGQTDRHGQPSPRPVSLAAAQAAIQLAVCAVWWFEQGAIRRVP